MIGYGWMAAGCAVSIALASVTSFFVGKDYGADGEKAKSAEALVAALAERDAKQRRIDALEASNARLEQTRQAGVREIYREIPTIIRADPVYRNVCINADGVHALDKARAVANGVDPGAADNPAGAVAGSAALDRPGDRKAPDKR